jgi:hypothetical protein
MQSVSFPARQARKHYRHELRTLTYVTLDAANGGIIRNLNHMGVAVQAVAPLRPQQRVRLRFELRFPRLRVETYGQVSWASPSGQCGIHFVDLPPRTGHEINQWIFSNLLDAAARDAHPRPMFGVSVVSIVREENSLAGNASEENDGLTVSGAPRPAIRLEPDSRRLDQANIPEEPGEHNPEDRASDPHAELSWLSRPLSGRALAWLVDGLVVTAALLLFALIFLSIVHELPPWQLTLGAAVMVLVLIAATYRTMFAVFGGASMGARLAQATSSISSEEGEGVDRFR